MGNFSGLTVHEEYESVKIVEAFFDTKIKKFSLEMG